MVERQKMKNLDGEYISRVLRFSSGDSLVQGLADKIWECCQLNNLYIADDLHTEDGECYSGFGNLSKCYSRLCPICTGELAKRNRRFARHIVKNEKLYVGENWFFITFTMPDLSLLDLPLMTCRSVINKAWRYFLSRNANTVIKSNVEEKKVTWFQSISRGGIKSEEFTVGEYQQYHYHIHLLSICRNRITSNNFFEIRREWTKALEFSFRKHDLKFECNTSSGYAVVNVKRVWNIEKSILELCKYITKTTDWAKIPSEQLAEIATIKRFPRMFEIYGESCKKKAKEIRYQSKKEVEKTGANVHTKKITVKKNRWYCPIFKDDKNREFIDEKISVNGETSNSNAPPKKSKSRITWRSYCQVLDRKDWLIRLEFEVSRCQEFRKRQLRDKYAFASFKTINGETF